MSVWDVMYVFVHLLHVCYVCYVCYDTSCMSLPTPLHDIDLGFSVDRGQLCYSESVTWIYLLLSCYV